MLVRITQQDVVYRYYIIPGHRAFIPDFGVYITWDSGYVRLNNREFEKQLDQYKGSTKLYNWYY